MRYCTPSTRYNLLSRNEIKWNNLKTKLLHQYSLAVHHFIIQGNRTTIAVIQTLMLLLKKFRTAMLHSYHSQNLLRFGINLNTSESLIGWAFILKTNTIAKSLRTNLRKQFEGFSLGSARMTVLFVLRLLTWILIDRLNI